MEHMEADPSSLYSPAPTLTRGLIHLFDMSGGLRIEKKVWILEKAGLDAVWEKKRLLTRCEEEDAWMEVDVQQYLGTDPMVSLFRGSVRSEEQGKVHWWADHILVPSVAADVIGILSYSFRMPDITLFFARPYLQFVPSLGEIADKSARLPVFISRLQRDEKETKDWKFGN